MATRVEKLIKPLEGLLVLDFAVFLAGPSAATRLADLGARVIKVERPDGGDPGRTLYINEVELDGDSLLFHSINRNKESIALDLKDPGDSNRARELIRRSDVVISSYRPGVAERIGLDYDSIATINPRAVVGAVTGYGSTGPWATRPGQDLLAQSLSGLPWLNGNADHPPMPFGLSVADVLAGEHLVQGVLAALVRRSVTGVGGRVDVSLLESVLDLQFEVYTTYLNDGNQLPVRSAVNNGNAYLGAPYGIYETADGYIAIAMGPIQRLGELLELTELQDAKPGEEFSRRDELKAVLASLLRTRATEHWLSILEPGGWWTSEVLTWDELSAHPGFKAIDAIQQIDRGPGTEMLTTRCPIRMDSRVLKSSLGAPRLGEHTEAIVEEFNLDPVSTEGAT